MCVCVLAMMKGWGRKTFWGSFNTGACSFSHTERGGGAPIFSTPLKNGSAKSFTLT